MAVIKGATGPNSNTLTRKYDNIPANIASVALKKVAFAKVLLNHSLGNL
jgi:hypothetical protein